MVDVTGSGSLPNQAQEQSQAICGPPLVSIQLYDFSYNAEYVTRVET